jgi:hypothetical protein
MPPGLRKNSMAVGTARPSPWRRAPRRWAWSSPDIRPPRSLRSSAPSASHPWERPAGPGGPCVPGSARAARQSGWPSQQVPHGGNARCIVAWRTSRLTCAGRAPHCLHWVPRSPCPPWPPARPYACASVSTAVIHSAAAASASRRKCMGVVPAWLAWPPKARLSRVWPTIAVTAATRKPSASSTGPARCESQESQSHPHHRRFADAPGSRPKARIAASTAMPSVSVSVSTRIEIARNRAAAQEGHAKAHALFFRERDHFDRQRQRKLLRNAHPFQRQRDAEHAVEGAGVGHRIDVRTEHESLCRSRPAAAKVRADCRRIHMHAHSQRFHAGAQMGMNVVHGRRQESPRDASRLFSHKVAICLHSAIAPQRASFIGAPTLMPHGAAAKPSAANRPASKDRFPRSQVSSTRPRNAAPRYGESLWRKCRIVRRDGPCCIRIENHEVRVGAGPPARLFFPSSPASRAVSAHPRATRSIPAFKPNPRRSSAVHITGSASPRLAMPPQARSQRPSSRRFIAGGQGEWSVVTMSINPSSSAAHNASRLALPANRRSAFELRRAIGNFFGGKPKILYAGFHGDRHAPPRASASIGRASRWPDGRCGSASRTPRPAG